MDNLTIFINKDEQIEIKGMMRELNNICEVIKLMSRDQFKLGYGLGLEYLADLSDIPGNTIAERIKAELE